MGITVQEEKDSLIVMRITGLFRKSELDAVQAQTAKTWGPDTTVKVLIIVENFQGWDRAADWGDLSFYAEYGDKMEKIAIVAEAKHQNDFLMFMGAGIRPTPIKFFPPEQIAQAREWLA